MGESGGEPGRFECVGSVAAGPGTGAAAGLDHGDGCDERAIDEHQSLTEWSLDEAAAAIASPWDSMLEAGRSYAAFALAEPSAFSVMSRLELARVDTPELWAERERGYFALAGIIDRAQRAGWASSRDGLDLIATTWGLVHGVVDLWVGGPLAAPFDGQTLDETLRRIVADVLVALDPGGAEAIQGWLDQADPSGDGPTKRRR